MDNFSCVFVLFDNERGDFLLLSYRRKGCGIHASYVRGPKLFRRSGAEFGEW